MAPAMNTQMFSHDAVRQLADRVRRCRRDEQEIDRRGKRDVLDRGVRFVDPGEGYLACGWIGKGRLAEPDDIVAAAEQLLRPAGALSGRHVLVTAGPTREDLDPVRYIGNRSSGRMGFAIADEAVRRGAHVTLVAGPTTLAAPPVAELVRVRSAEEMHRAVLGRADAADVVVMAAAVADYTPEVRADQKVAKGADTITLTLKRTPDILKDLGTRRLATGAKTVLVGFAAETDDVVARAMAKLHAKRVDLIVANDVSRSDAGFDVDTNEVTLVGPEGPTHVPLQSKARVAAAILDRVEPLLAAPLTTPVQQ
jgi:phosphopantothenoylcysteine decarboxylase / phosphopantothenate---cysteine ligase